MNDDVIGEALLDYTKGLKNQNITVTSNITEDDEIPVNYLFRSAKELPEIEVKALELCRGKVLDVGGGSGIHSLILQNKGIDVKAIDISKGAVEVMSQQGIKKAEQINFHELEGEQFDTLLFLMNGVGIAGTVDGLKIFLNKSKELLSEGGQILMDSSDIQYLFTEDDGSVWINLNSSYYGEVIYQMKYKNSKTAPFNWLFVDYLTLEQIATDLGFKVKFILAGENDHYLAQISL